MILWGKAVPQPFPSSLHHEHIQGFKQNQINEIPIFTLIQSTTQNPSLKCVGILREHRSIVIYEPLGSPSTADGDRSAHKTQSTQTSKSNEIKKNDIRHPKTGVLPIKLLFIRNEFTSLSF